MSENDRLAFAAKVWAHKELTRFNIHICGENLGRFPLSVKFAYQLIFLSKNPKPTQCVFLL
jgi:hypothetical protein